jgi:hypothetical protein
MIVKKAERVQHHHTPLVTQHLQHDAMSVHAEMTSQRRLAGLARSDVDGLRAGERSVGE